MKQQIVMVCGPDMTGKTQIAHELSRRTGFPYFKASNERMTFMTGGWGVGSNLESARQLAQDMSDRHKFRIEDFQRNRFLYDLCFADPRAIDIFKQLNCSLVMDRGFPCEYAYSRVMKRESDEVVLWQIDQAYADLGAKIVICRRSNYDGIIDDIDPKINQPILQELDYEYQNFAKKTRCKVLHLGVDDEDLDQEVGEILAFLGVD